MSVQENAGIQDEETAKSLQEIQKYVDKKKELYNALFNFLEDSEDSDMSFKNLVDSQNREDFEQFLHLITDLANNHHRDDQFFNKIYQILEYYSNQIKQTFSNLEIFHFFISNKLILLFLFENKIITVDDDIYLELMNIVEENGNKYCHFFYPEIKEFIGDEKSASIKEEILSLRDDIFDEFNEKRHKGENDLYICSLIRDDSIEEFISYINKNCISVSSNINHSIFETNLYLIENQATLIEYAAFFGSIQIFRYLKTSGANLCDSLWYCSIHSKNPELLHLLEEDNVDLPRKYENSLIESIKCHHNDFAAYIKENLMYVDDPSRTFDEKFVIAALQSHNYEYFPPDFTKENELFYLIRFHYDTLANLFMKRNKKRIEMSIKEGNISLKNATNRNMIDVLYYLLSNIKRIDEGFFFRSELMNIALPPSIKSIGKNAFSESKYLKQILISSSVDSIGDNAFSNCSEIEQIIIPSSVTTIGDNVFYECSSLKHVQIPSSVTSIGSNLFSGCTSLVYITIPSSVTSIKKSAFYGCSSLAQITIPSSVTSIKKSAFYGCSSLAQITIPSSVTSIEDFAFSKCQSLKKVIIPSSVTSIGMFAFFNCSSLRDLSFTASNVEIGDYAFFGCTALNRPELKKMEPFTNIDDYEINDILNNKHLKVTHKATGKIYIMSTYTFDKIINFLDNVVISKNKNVIKIHSFRFPLSEEERAQMNIDLTGYITISDFMANDSIYNNTMKYLKHPMFDKKIMNPTIRSKIIFGVASIMKHLHKKGIIHRDLKLSKVYLDENFEPIINCFYLSTHEANLQEVDLSAGKLLYMAPEIISDKHYSFPADVFSYAFFLYNMFSSQIYILDHNKKISSPFPFMRRILNGCRPQRQENIPDQYWDLITKCWAHHPNERPTFEEITEILKDDEFALYEYGIETNLEQLHEYQQRIDVD